MKNYWNTSLLISLIIHAGFLVALPVFLSKNFNLAKIDDNKNTIEIIPQENKSQRRSSIRSYEKNIDMQAKKVPPYLDGALKEALFSKDVPFEKVKINDNEMRDALLSELPQEKELTKNPAYMDYYQLIRKKIRDNAYRYYESRDGGEVFLTFIIFDSGKLHSVHLNNDSGGSSELIQTALKSIKRATPFPPFPKELDYKKLQFNISIYFKNN